MPDFSELINNITKSFGSISAKGIYEKFSAQSEAILDSVKSFMPTLKVPGLERELPFDKVVDAIKRKYGDKQMNFTDALEYLQNLDIEEEVKDLSKTILGETVFDKITEGEQS